MRISKLLMPAVTLAGALALAGCGGGSDTPANPGNGGNGGGGGNKPPECKAAGVILNDAGDDCIPDPDYVDPEAASKERTDNAKALMEALEVEGPATAVTSSTIPVGSSAAGDPVAIPNLKKTSKTVAALNGWKGAEYKGTGTGDLTGEVVAYSNEGSAETQPFAGLYPANDISTIKYYTFSADGSGNGVLAWGGDNIGGGDFPTNGTKTFELINDQAVTFSGTYNGALGTYSCTGNTCTAAADDGEVTALGAGWRFTPAQGATVPKPSAYLQFGWWVRKAKDGTPIDAGAFYRDTGGDAGSSNSPESLIGSATYKGAAAGKFAISDGARPADDLSGHFTANATLEADFGPASGDGAAGTLKGTIDGFTLNDTTKGDWVVSLEESAITAGGVATGGSDRAKWALDGENFSDAGGDWTAVFYEDDDDDNDIPNHVIGGFEAEIGSTHHLEGAFGASQE